MGKKQQFGDKQRGFDDRDRTDRESGQPVQLDPEQEKMDRPERKQDGTHHDAGQPAREDMGGRPQQGGAQQHR